MLTGDSMDVTIRPSYADLLYMHIHEVYVAPTFVFHSPFQHSLLIILVVTLFHLNLSN
jgi:hypothetical protein